MDTQRKRWNRDQQKLQSAISANKHEKAIALFMEQHARLHSRFPAVYSFEDEVLKDLSEEHFRCIPPRGQHSIAWIIFHLARIEDITMNLLVAGTPQLYLQNGWAERLNVDLGHSGNEMEAAGIARLSAQVDLKQLRLYRRSVARRTREIVRKLKPGQLGQKVEAARLPRVMAEGALLPEAAGILQYWSKRTIAGLLLMPPTRHNFVHLNEAARIRQKLQRAK